MNLLILSLALAQAPIFFTVNSAPPAAGTPTFSPGAGSYNGTQTVTLSSPSASCSSYIYWNTTGSPTISDTRSVSASVAATATLYAKVIGCPNYSNSAVGSAAYTITGGGGTNYGLTTIGAHGAATFSSAQPVVQKITIPASKTCTSLTFYAQSITTGRKYRVGCYAAGASPSGSVVAQSAEITSSGDPGGWYTRDFVSSFNSGAGGDFWCGGWADGDINGNYDDAAAGSMVYSGSSSYSSAGLPSWPGGGGTIAALNSLYVTCQ